MYGFPEGWHLRHAIAEDCVDGGRVFAGMPFAGFKAEVQGGQCPGGVGEAGWGAGLSRFPAFGQRPRVYRQGSTEVGGREGNPAGAFRTWLTVAKPVQRVAQLDDTEGVFRARVVWQSYGVKSLVRGLQVVVQQPERAQQDRKYDTKEIRGNG